MNRCEWSDLPAGQCGHCLGHVGLPTESTPVEPLTVPGVRIWPDEMPATMPRSHTIAASRPRGSNVGTSAIDVITGRHSGGNECRCGRPTDAYVCEDCAKKLLFALDDVADWLADEIEVTMTRQRAAAIDGGSPSATQGLAWHEKAADATRTLHGLLALWVRFSIEESVRGILTDWPEDNPKSMARWLMHAVHGLTLRDIGPDMVDEITDAVAECRRVVFWKRKNRIYLGTCGQRVEDEDGVTLLDTCPGEVYSEEGDAVGYCDDCEQGVTVVIRKSEIEKELDGRLCTAAEIATFAVHLGLDAPRERVRKRVHYWHRHKRILARGSRTEKRKGQDRDVPTFRYGEVRAMLYAEFGRETA